MIAKFHCSSKAIKINQHLMKSYVFKEHHRDMTKIHIDIYETLIIIGARSNPPELVMLRFLLMWIPSHALSYPGCPLNG
jgi:hypothetical protein